MGFWSESRLSPKQAKEWFDEIDKGARQCVTEFPRTPPAGSLIFFRRQNEDSTTHMVDGYHPWRSAKDCLSGDVRVRRRFQVDEHGRKIDFQKRIFERRDLVIVWYYGKDSPLQLRHGNCKQRKGNQAYRRTEPEHLVRIKSLLKTHDNNKILEIVPNSRGRKQIMNTRYLQKKKQRQNEKQGEAKSSPSVAQGCPKDDDLSLAVYSIILNDETNPGEQNSAREAIEATDEPSSSSTLFAFPIPDEESWLHITGLTTGDETDTCLSSINWPTDTEPEEVTISFGPELEEPFADVLGEISYAYL